MPGLPGEITTSPRVNPVKNNKPATASASRLMATNSKRVGFTIINRSTTTLYLDFETSVSPFDYWIALPPMQGYEMPFRSGKEVFGVWSGSSVEGVAQIREFIEG